MTTENENKEVPEAPNVTLLSLSDVYTRLKRLAMPLQAHEIDWRVGSSSMKDGVKKTSALAYIDNRTVYDRFDKYFSIFWSSNVQNVPGTWFRDRVKKIKYKKEVEELEAVNYGGGFLASITINYDGGQITRTDGADFSNVEPFKGGVSDSLKRCAHAFGLGRELYRYPKVYFEGDDKIWNFENELAEVTNKYLRGETFLYNTVNLSKMKGGR